MLVAVKAGGLCHLPDRVPHPKPLRPAAADQGRPLLQGEAGLLRRRGAADHQDKLPPGRRLPIEEGCLGERGADGLLVDLAQLPAQGGGPVTEDVQQIRQGGVQLVGRLVENHGALLPGQGLEALPPLPPAGGEEALEGEASGGQAREGQGADQGAAPGNSDDVHPVLGAQAHQLLPRVADGGHPRVGYQSAALPGQQPAQHRLAGGGAVVLMVADQTLFQAKMVEKLQGDPGVLGGDEIRGGEGLQGPGAQVPQVPDGRGHQVERSGHRLGLLYGMSRK